VLFVGGFRWQPSAGIFRCQGEQKCRQRDPNFGHESNAFLGLKQLQIEQLKVDKPHRFVKLPLGLFKLYINKNGWQQQMK